MALSLKTNAFRRNHDDIFENARTNRINNVGHRTSYT